MRPALIVALCLAPSLAGAAPLDTLLTEAARSCAEIEGGVMTAPAKALIRTDLSGDGVPDALLDESRLSCSTSASLYAATGGSMLRAIVGDSVTSWQATGWRLIGWNQDKILLIGRDGTWCGATGAERCYEALVWSEGRFLTVGPPGRD